MKKPSLWWRALGWIFSVSTIIMAIDSPTPAMLTMCAVVIFYWGFKWKKPLAKVGSLLASAAMSVAGFAWTQLTKGFSAIAQRCGRGGDKRVR